MQKLTERHVQAIWYDAHLRPNGLTTRRGSAVEVVSPGEWNLGPGPDFRNAVLEIGRDHTRVTGDVEIHLCPADWDLHGHGADPAYRNVIAHVTWGCGPDPATLPAGAVSIWLGRFVAPTFSPESVDVLAYPYAKLPIEARPCERRFAGNPDLARDVLRKAGQHRLRMKARRLAGRLTERGRVGGRRQVFYEEVMTALGYVSNAASFRHVAERVPIAELPQETESAVTALLTAGAFETWHRTSLRPNNSPEQRLSSAAGLFTSTPTMELSSASDFSPKACRKMVSAMSRGHCIGRGRASAILANVIAPFALAEDRLASLPEWLPPEDISSPVRLMAFRLFGRDHNPSALYAKNGLLIQGLLQIHRDFCRIHHPECTNCSVGNGVDASRPAA